MSCLDEETVVAFVDRQLDAAASARVESHLYSCGACRRLLSSYVKGSQRDPEDGKVDDRTSVVAAEAPADRTAPMTQPSAPDQPDQMLLGVGSQVDHYEVLRSLGRGGMGEVYLARDLQLGRRVALKVLHQHHRDSPAAVERLRFEARATARFNHPNIVGIYGVGSHEGHPYVALEYVEGRTLLGQVAEGPTPPIEAARITLAVARALAEAHAHGILHRDLKPSNVMVARDGRVRVLDFGLAKDLSTADEAGLAEPTYPGADAQAAGPVLRGTPAYMAPEQWRGERASAATDIWALGLLLHELLTGQRLFRGRTEALAVQVVSEEPVKLDALTPDVPQALVELLSACLGKDRGARPAAAAVVEALERVVEPNRRRLAIEGDSPFCGLSAFTEAQAERFFGRDDEIATLVERLRTETTLAVVGPSGAGKTSFVQAGLVPRLRETGSWLVLQMRPSARPWAALAAALLPELTPAPAKEALAAELAGAPSRLGGLLRQIARQHHGRVLLVVDQAEELSTLVESTEERERFARAVAGAAGDIADPVRTILTLRDGFLSRVAESAELRQTLGRVVLLRRPDERVLGEMLRLPVELAGYRFEDAELVAEMVEALRGVESCLPLLQFAGQALWERRDREQHLLTRASYAEIGGVAGALANHADAVINLLTAPERETARQLLLRLIMPDGTRRALVRGELLRGLGPAAEGVLARLVEGRLLALRGGDDQQEDAPEAELAHESLILGWRRLARWVDESREDRRFIDDLDRAAERWQRRGEPADALWHGGALRDAQRALRRSTFPLAPRAQRFIAASQRRERRQQRLRRVAVGAALLVLAAGALFYGAKAREAREQRDRARQQEGVAQRRRVEAQLESARAALAAGGTLQARAQLRTVLEGNPEARPVAVRALWWRLSGEPLVWQRELHGGGYAAVFVESQDLVAVGWSDGAIYLLDSRSGEMTRTLRSGADQLFALALSPDQRWLASAAWNGELLLWDTSTWRVARTMASKGASSFQLAFTPDGRLLASSGAAGKIWLWEVPSGRRVRELSGHQRSTTGLAFTPDGQSLFSVGVDGMLRSWRLDSGASREVATGHTDPTVRLAMSRDGRHLATAGHDRVVVIWDARSVAPLRRFVGHNAAINGVAFSPDGRLLATGGKDKRARIWSVPDGRLHFDLPGPDRVARLQFSPDGKQLAISGSAVRLYRVAALPQPPGGHRQAVNAIAFSPDGRTLASGAGDQRVRLWNAEGGESVRVLEGHSDTIYDLAFSPDGGMLASGGGDGVRVWDVASGAPQPLEEPSGLSLAVRFDPQGGRLASAGDSGIRLWAVKSGELLRRWRMRQTMPSLAIDRSGRWLASGGRFGTVGIWPLRGGGAMGALPKHAGAVFGLSFFDGDRAVVSAGTDGAVQLAEVRSGRLRQRRTLGSRLMRVATNPSGEQLAVVGADGRLRLLDRALRAVRTIEAHAGEANSVAYGPKGQLVATGGDDAAVRLWRVSDGRPIWHAPLLLPDSAKPLRLLSHRGWQWLGARGERPADPPPAAWSRRLIERARVVRTDRQGKSICVHTFEGQLEWWTPEGRAPLGRWTPPPGTRVVAATSRGCLALSADRLVVFGRGEQAQTLYTGTVDAVGTGEDAGELVLAAAKGAVVSLAPGRAPVRLLQADPGIVALTATGTDLILGYASGLLRRASREGARAGRGERGRGRVLTLEQTPSGRPSALLAGPGRTLLAGYVNGAVGLWDLQRGRLMRLQHLHGPVTFVRRHGGELVVATALGDHLVWDIAALELEACELMRAVWRQVPVVWEDGRPRVRRPPPGHRCAGERPAETVSD